ncbi:MAG: hypothetical protein A2Y28_02870 [Chlamydiae bacterium GWC2_50_10]|nr:MAG: hypothetical protein A2Z85_04670 [Chlamydiae bacterium GWA2_50_15]OGN54788.1 MAG: hypothetical protein A2Y28_02870 [Chlamydiae bacterium GWC2_50_10]OGN58758.1 MAG: hypothetical protein A3D18_03990 [Chlamydiae bacterium RIFCSPHIGHO2_02_FULL_49_29]OGN70501.1 MAG: hypothetical protein A3I15_03105 [Chlamydiae bacterium RIFCSPLOWO2_02_FULL_49_12]OGN74803.1 MAG: hypothetical protein A3G30_03445 [Chlamydiae bacterium RIFCSPLOWO2_12_FULL_49_12]HAZ15068.1 hypothetical protein [Parachlamydiales 
MTSENHHFPNALSTMLTAPTIMCRDYLEGIEIENPFFSASRSFVVKGAAEASFALLSLICLVEIAVRSVLWAAGYTIGCFASDHDLAEQCFQFSRKISPGFKEAGSILFFNLICLYFNIMKESIQTDFPRMDTYSASG